MKNPTITAALLENPAYDFEPAFDEVGDFIGVSRPDFPGLVITDGPDPDDFAETCLHLIREAYEAGLNARKEEKLT